MRFSAFGGRAGIYARVTAQRLRGFSPGENGSSTYEMASIIEIWFRAVHCWERSKTSMPVVTPLVEERAPEELKRVFNQSAFRFGEAYWHQRRADTGAGLLSPQPAL